MLSWISTVKEKNLLPSFKSWPSFKSMRNWKWKELFPRKSTLAPLILCFIFVLSCIGILHQWVLVIQLRHLYFHHSLSLTHCYMYKTSCSNHFIVYKILFLTSNMFSELEFWDSLLSKCMHTVSSLCATFCEICWVLSGIWSN